MQPLLLILVPIALVSAGPAGRAGQDLHILKISSGPRGVESNGVFTIPEERSRFNRAADREVVVYFQWEGPPGRHRVVAEAKPSKIDLRPGMRVISHWEMPMPAAGVYRAEVLIDDAPAWREFVTIVP